MPVTRNAHQAQVAATPPSRTRLVTMLGVSVLNVVATIETPTSHHGAARPDVKNSAVLLPARFAKKMAGRNDTTTDTPMTVQSSGVKCIRRSLRISVGRRSAYATASNRALLQAVMP